MKWMTFGTCKEEGCRWKSTTSWLGSKQREALSVCMSRIIHLTVLIYFSYSWPFTHKMPLVISLFWDNKCHTDKGRISRNIKQSLNCV